MKKLLYLVFSLLFVGAISAQNFSLSPKTNTGHEGVDSPTDIVVIHYDGDNNNSIGDGGTTYIGGARFRAELFAGLVGGQMQSVMFFYSQDATGLTLKIYDAGTATDPGPLLVDQPLDLGTLTVGDWNTVDLGTPLDIDGDDLWVCLQVEDATGANFPFGVDAGPADPDGDFVNDSGTWQHLNDFGLNFNWNIRALVEEPGGTIPGLIFMDDFEAYTAGQQLACQNPTDWTTWSQDPCNATEDPFVSNNYAFSGVNSTVIVQNNDLVKPLATTTNAITSGKYQISFQVYIPAGKAGYFNTMSEFFGSPQYWAMEVYFDQGGSGRLLTGDPDVTFTWAEDTWQSAVVVVDLDNDMGEFWFDGNLIHQWQWTLGASGGTGPLQLDVNDIFGATANDEMYFDDYEFIDLLAVPVELTSFAGNVNASGDVVLNWSTATELNNQMFEIQRRTQDGQYATVGYVDGHGTTTEPQQYSYVDNTVENGTYYYRLKQIDFGGTYEYSQEVEVDVQGPLTFNLEQNYPNPFNPSTNIRYSVAQQSHVKLAVYNLIGEEVAVLVNKTVESGFYEVNFNAANLPSGLYLYKLETPGFVKVKKMMLLK